MEPHRTSRIFLCPSLHCLPLSAVLQVYSGLASLPAPPRISEVLLCYMLHLAISSAVGPAWPPHTSLTAHRPGVMATILTDTNRWPDKACWQHSLHCVADPHQGSHFYTLVPILSKEPNQEGDWICQAGAAKSHSGSLTSSATCWGGSRRPERLPGGFRAGSVV
jgi:hypothetical protein